ncbi:probable serine/threonine-protein kinase kinX [Daktulosphaira vitifoliae]|uniref:probable serine/threonine-protein kinase kinX n=1 Tax=Daktulosphaira vitifoliae TaxID=58002 RepID=UPI0021AA5759|nr:probable serine/threonine-protein kinase kinX [Daktulosphaira vitifoliae]
MPGSMRLLDEEEEDWVPQNNGRRRYAIPEKIDSRDEDENEEDDDIVESSGNWQRMESITTPHPKIPVVAASRRFDRTPQQPKNAVRIDTSLLNGESVELPTYINVPVTLKCKFVKVPGTDNKFETVVEGMYPGHTTTGSQLDHPSSQILQQLMDTAEKWRGTIERSRNPRKILYEDEIMNYDQDINPYGRHERYAEDIVQNEENLQPPCDDQVEQTKDYSDDKNGELRSVDKQILESQQIDDKQQTNIDQQYDNEQFDNDKQTDNSQQIENDQEIDNDKPIDSDQQVDYYPQTDNNQQINDDQETIVDMPVNNDLQTDYIQQLVTDVPEEEEVTEQETESPQIIEKSIGQRVVEAAIATAKATEMDITTTIKTTNPIQVQTELPIRKSDQIKTGPLSVLQTLTTIPEIVETVNLVSTTPMPVSDVRQPSVLTATTSKSDYTSVIAGMPQETFFEYMDGESNSSSEVPVDIRPLKISH